MHACIAINALKLSLGTSRTHHRATHKNLYSEFSSTLYRKRRGARTHSSSHTRIYFFSKRRMMTPGLCIWESHTQIIEIYQVQCFDVSRQLVHQREV